MCVHAKSLQLCPILCDTVDSSLLGSFVHGILQARILEWIAVPFSSLAMEKVSELEVCVLLLDTTCFSLGGFEAGSWEKAGN